MTPLAYSWWHHSHPSSSLPPKYTNSFPSLGHWISRWIFTAVSSDIPLLLWDLPNCPTHHGPASHPQSHLHFWSSSWPSAAPKWSCLLCFLLMPSLFPTEGKLLQDLPWGSLLLTVWWNMVFCHITFPYVRKRTRGVERRGVTKSSMPSRWAQVHRCERASGVQDWKSPLFPGLLLCLLSSDRRIT